MAAQLPLGIGLPDGAVFETFHAGSNAAAVATLDRAARGDEPVVFVYGEAGSGRTHLLQAACAAAIERGRRAAFLPLAHSQGIAPAMVEGWDAYDLVCVDDIDAVAGDSNWEEALFALFNGLRARHGAWAAAAGDVPSALGLSLRDLASRLAAGPTFRLQRLDDAGQLAALRLRAGRRGLDLSDEVGRYLLRRVPRDMGTLYELLERLDAASLAQQRRITIPLVKQILESKP